MKNKSQTPAPLTMNILYDKNNIQGQKRDAEIIELCSRKLNGLLKYRIGTVRCVDPREHPSACDVQVHIDFPSLANLSWARVNILVVNPAKFSREVYEGNLHHFDYVIFRSKKTMIRFCEAITGLDKKAIYIPWSTNWEKSKINMPPAREFNMFLGNSESKFKAARAIINLWKESYPRLTVYAANTFVDSPSSSDKKSSVADIHKFKVPSWVTLKLGNYTDDERANAIRRTRGCIVVAETDSAPHTLLEALESGSIIITNNIDVYLDVADKERYSNNIIMIETNLNEKDMDICADFASITQDYLDGIVTRFNEAYDKPFSLKKNTETDATWNNLWTMIGNLIDVRPSNKMIPPPVEVDKCPDISVVTLLYNRRKFFDIAGHNMLLTDYPKSKIQWILVDDSDDMNDSPSDKVIKFQNENPEFKEIIYIPLSSKTSIGAKRNLGVERATTDIILMMDDDDHYPQTSFRRRVSWLLSSWPDNTKPSCCGCATIAMYDLVKAVSAVNVPPHDLPIGARLSEATLTFYKSFWEERHFLEVDIAEGEEWIKGREIVTMELPPQQIIVAFNHKQNSSSRKIPDRPDKGCFWGFPKEYLQFIHEIAGMKIEWEDK
jgi:hypothetical protein